MTMTTALRRSLALLLLVCLLHSHHAAAASADAPGFATDNAVLLGRATGVVANACGSVQARVSPKLILTIQFNIALQSQQGCGAGSSVTATTNTEGRVVRIAKGTKQACKLGYTSGGALQSVKCSTTRRQLGRSQEQEGEAQTTEVASEENGERGRRGPPRQLASPCSSCVNLVKDAFATKIKALCGTSFASKVPSQHRWAATAAAALCDMTSTLGMVPSAVANQTCRCCALNADCESGVCSAGACLSDKLKIGELCPDGDPADCANGVSCARNAYPYGNYVCCNDTSSVFSPTMYDWYCPGTQPDMSTCDRNAICSSGVCSAGVCLSQKIAVHGACPDRQNDDCASGVCSDAICLSDKIAAGNPCPDWENADCTSGVCSAGICLAQRIGIGEECPDMEPDDCENNICASSLYPFGPYVCCNGTAVKVAVPADISPGNDEFYEVCAGQATGSPCNSNEMCSSGSCSTDEVCVD